MLNNQATPGAQPVASGCPFYIGGFYSPGADRCQSLSQYFNGLIDEVRYYKRALTADEIRADFDAAGGGQCTVPPKIIAQPTNRTVMAGGAATFNVTASSTAPLSYHWSRNGTNIHGATNSTLSLLNVKPNQAGHYAVLVANPYGAVASSNATLVVNLPPLQTVFKNGRMQLSWRANPPGFILETTADLASGNWVPVAAATNQIGDQFFFPMSGGSNAYYRLHFNGP